MRSFLNTIVSRSRPAHEPTTEVLPTVQPSSTTTYPAPSLPPISISTAISRSSITSEPKSPSQPESTNVHFIDGGVVLSPTRILADDDSNTSLPPIRTSSRTSAPAVVGEVAQEQTLQRAPTAQSTSNRSFWHATGANQSPGFLQRQTTAGTGTQSWWWARPELKTRCHILLIWGVLLIIILSTYLGIALDKRIATQVFHVAMILIILITAMFFCHSLVRLCLIASKPYSYPDEMSTTNNDILHLRSGPGPHGYAQPDQPIPIDVVPGQSGAALDDDADLTRIPPPPPAYGIWRQSVRVNPEQFYWIKRTSAEIRAVNEPQQERGHRATRSGQSNSSIIRPSITEIRRPPSYASDSGTYAVQTPDQFQSQTSDDIPPLHPSEIGRITIVP